MSQAVSPWRWPSAEASSASWIEKNPGVCGGDACVRRMRIPVWSLVESRRMGMSDKDILDSLPALTQDDLNMAWAYYESHKKEIDDAIALERQAMDEPIDGAIDVK